MEKDRALILLQNGLLFEVHGSYYEALKMAIDALKKESCEDYVSRTEAIKTAIEATDDWDGGYNLTRADIIEKAIKSLPSVQQEQKIGKWIDTDNYYQRWKCSECGCHTRDAEPNFCPNCGCRMMKEGE